MLAGTKELFVFVPPQHEGIHVVSSVLQAVLIQHFGTPGKAHTRQSIVLCHDNIPRLYPVDQRKVHAVSTLVEYQCLRTLTFDLVRGFAQDDDGDTELLCNLQGQVNNRTAIVAIRKDRWVANLFYRLADKNTRNGIQIFEDFCKSGHMKEKDILAMRVLGDDAQIPAYRFENVLLRKNRRFYNGDESNFVNLFASDYNDDFPDPFVRADILNWLYQVQALSGPTGDKGLFQVSELARSLQVYGHSLAVIYRELAYLARKNLVLCENSAMPIEEGDLVKITIPGALHLQMLRNVSYLSACAEDTLFKNTEVMTRISNRLKFHESDSKLVVVLNARDLVNYLIEYRKEYLTNSDELVSEKAIISSVDLNDSLHAVEQWIQADENLKKTISEIDYFTVDMDVDACVVSKNSGGVVCTIADKDVKGFISSLEPKYSFPRDVYSKIKPGDILKCKVMEFDFTHRSFQLKYLN